MGGISFARPVLDAIHSLCDVRTGMDVLASTWRHTYRWQKVDRGACSLNTSLE